MRNNKIIIAIDGFSSCGKSTMAKEFANAIDYIHVDSGALYRAITLFALQNNLINRKDGIINEVALKKLISNINIYFKPNSKTGKSETILNSVNVENEIRSMEIANFVSKISSISFVRKFVDCTLRKFGEEKGIIMDGRDIGTTVFPNAELKIFVTADTKVRAERRLKELLEKGTNISLDEVIKSIEERDFNDQNRKESPLVRAEDAIVLDNSKLTREQQSKWLLETFLNKIENI